MLPSPLDFRLVVLDLENLVSPIVKRNLPVTWQATTGCAQKNLCIHYIT